MQAGEFNRGVDHQPQAGPNTVAEEATAFAEDRMGDFNRGIDPLAVAGLKNESEEVRLSLDCLGRKTDARFQQGH